MVGIDGVTQPEHISEERGTEERWPVRRAL